MKTIYIGCPATIATGGPTLAHQLCYKLRIMGYNSKMYYYGKFDQTPVHPTYEHFNNDYVMEVIDSDDNIIIAPETNTNLLKKMTKSTKVIWWMSVDNYFNFLKSKRNVFNNFMGLSRVRIKNNDLLHFVQSIYAQDFLKTLNIEENRIFYLSDYLDEVFIKDSISQNSQKENYVLYNPKKGFEFTKKIMEQAPHINWVPLENLSSKEMKNLMEKSKVYIDFGNHPGKDRIPREAAINGCCVITGKKGAAKNKEDIKILEEYKFKDSNDMIGIIIGKIMDIMNDYPLHFENFSDYRQKITQEEKQFELNIKDIFSTLIKSSH